MDPVNRAEYEAAKNLPNCLDCIHILHFEHDGCLWICGKIPYGKAPPTDYFDPHGYIPLYARECSEFKRSNHRTQARHCADWYLEDV